MSKSAGPHARDMGSASGYAALVGLAGAAWLLILLARLSSFSLWPLALIPLLAALACGVVWWLRCDWFDRLVPVGLVLLASLLYWPPAQHIALSGDAAIYPNEAFYLLRTGGLSGVHEALAALSPDQQDLFYVGSDEQFGGVEVVRDYAGIVYGGYYLTDGDRAEITSSRMPQTIVWMAFAAALAGDEWVFAVSFVAACLALILLYALAVQVLGRDKRNRWLSLWVPVLLAVTYAQIYLARQPLSEITGQLWTLAGFCAAVGWITSRRPLLLVLTAFFWVTAWSARLDAILLIGPGALLLMLAAHDRDRRSLVAIATASIPLLALAWLGANRAYVGATRQLVFAIYDVLTPVAVIGLIAMGATLAAAWVWGARMTGRAGSRPARVAGWILFALAAFVIAWSTLPNPLRVDGLTRHWQEIPWFSSTYLSPLFYWLALAGVGLTLWRGGTRAQAFLIACWAGLGAAYFYTYTTSPVYPIALRRLASDLLPLTAVLAGLALAKLPERRWTAAAQASIAAIALLWVGALSGPLIAQHEARNDLAFVRELQLALPDNAAVVFEPQGEDSFVGWLAAPLFSIFDDWSLLLESDEPDTNLYAQAIHQLHRAGRTVVVVTQAATLPASLLPEGQAAVESGQLTWDSSLIGQSHAPYPPLYWEFSVPVHLFTLTPSED